MENDFFFLLSPACIEKIQSEFSSSHASKRRKFIHFGKKFTWFFFLFLILSLLPIFNIDLTFANPQTQNKAKPTLSVGLFNYYPIVYEKNGVPTGFHLELLKEIAAKEGWILDYHVSGSLKNVLNGLESKTIDIGMALVPTTSRIEYLDFTQEKNALLKGQVFVRSDRKDIRELKDLHQKTVGFIREDALGDYFLEICSKIEISPYSKRTNSYDDLSAAIISGDVDAGLFNHLQGGYYSQNNHAIRSTPIIFKPMEVQYAVPKGTNASIIKSLDNYLGKMKRDPSSSYQDLKKIFLTDSSHLQPNINQREVLIIILICLLVITLGIMVGLYAVNKVGTSHANHSRPYIRDIILCTLSISLFYWFLDSLMLWFAFTDGHNLTLLEATVTKIPSENLYIRGMFFMMSCFFGVFLVKYISRYEEMYNVLMISVNRFEQLTDNAKDMIFHMSLPSGKYEFVTKASSRIFGYSPEEFYKNPLLIKDLIHPTWTKNFRTHWQSLLEGKTPTSCEFKIIDKDGQVKWVNQRNTVYYDSNGVPNALEGIVTDVTESKCSPTPS